MTRLALLPLLVALWAPSPAGSAPDEARERAQQLIREASELAGVQQYDQALARLGEAQETAPDYYPVQSWLAHVYELKGEKDQALTHVAALLALNPDSEYGREAARRLFYRPPFPRRITPATLPLSPLAFTHEVCDLGPARLPGAPAQVKLCYTTSAKYPDDAPEGGPLVERLLPLPGDEPAQERFNRVVYGYQEVPETGDFALAVVVYYPSALLSGSGRDLAPIAQILAHLMLRFRCYSEYTLGLARQGDAEGVNRLYLGLGGPPGAQRSEADIYLYRVLSDDRSPLEWTRQLAHECGHLLIPRLGGFAQPEMWGNGALGERLFISLLADEAARVSAGAWPSEAAAHRLDALWPGSHIAAEEYLAQVARAPLADWAAAGPASELIVGEDEAALRYYLGFSLYLLAAHGPGGLREVIRSCAGTTVADFVYTYKQTAARWANEGPLSLGPGCFDPTAAKLTTPPPAAALAPSRLTLSAGDSVTYPVFLPTGQWRLALGLPEAAPPVKVFVSFDGGAEAEVSVGGGAAPTPVGALPEGWHRLAIRLPDGQPPLHLTGLVFSQATTA